MTKFSRPDATEAIGVWTNIGMKNDFTNLSLFPLFLPLHLERVGVRSGLGS